MNKITEDDYILVVNKIRGTVMTAFVHLELMMDLYICEKFCDTPAKISELASTVVTPIMNWSSKLDMFKLLIKKYNPSFDKENKVSYKRFKQLIEDRNRFAHYPADYKNGIHQYNTSDIVIILKRFKTIENEKTKIIEYTQDHIFSEKSINDIIEDCGYLTERILNMCNIKYQ